MAQTNASAKTSQDDILRTTYSAIANNTTAIRFKIEEINRELAALQDRKQGLEQQMLSIKARFYPNLPMKEVQDMRSDRLMVVEPVQAMEHKDPGFYTKDQVYSYNENRIKETAGTEVFEAAVRKIDSELQAVQAKIRNYIRDLGVLNDRLAQNASKGTGVTNETLQHDRIGRSRYASVVYLEHLSVMYLNDTTDPGDPNKRAWPKNDPNKSRNLVYLRQTFNAHAQSFPELLNQEVKFDSSDPGAASNRILLTRLLMATRQGLSASAPPEIEAQVSKYVNSQKAALMDRGKSAGIVKKTEPPPPAGNAMSDYNKTYPVAMVNLMGKTYHTEYSLGSLKDCILHAIRKNYEATYQGLPACNPPALSEVDQQKQDADNQAKADQAKGAAAFAEAAAVEPLDVLKSYQGDIMAIRSLIVSNDTQDTSGGGQAWKVLGYDFVARNATENQLLGKLSILEKALKGDVERKTLDWAKGYEVVFNLLAEAGLTDA